LLAATLYQGNPGISYQLRDIYSICRRCWKWQKERRNNNDLQKKCNETWFYLPVSFLRRTVAIYSFCEIHFPSLCCIGTIHL